MFWCQVFVHSAVVRRLVAPLLWGCTCLAAPPALADNPNVVFIMADDLGIGDVQCYGRDRCQIDTPNIDQLAREGMRFTDAHTVASVCVPVRVSIMTGRYPWRFRRPRPDGPWGFLHPRIPTSGFTLARLLNDQGYRTGYVGKWHLGTLMQTTDGKPQGPTNVDYRKPLKIAPPQYGFHESFILPGSLDMYPYVFARGNEFVGNVTAQKGWSAFNRVGPAEQDFEDYRVLDTFSQEAEQFIARHADGAREGKPFFLYLALTSPHTPVSPNPSFQGRSALGPYGDFVMETDHCVGRVMRALEAHGIQNNTIVVVTSDHGAASYAGTIPQATVGQIRELEQQGHYASGIYRGYKFSVYEGGLRVPFVVRWPDVVQPGSVCGRLVGLNDLMRTLADICSAQLPDNAAPDSISFYPLLSNPAGPPTRSEMILRSPQYFVVRRGPWKLCLCPGSGAAGRWGNEPKSADAWKQAVQKFGRQVTRADLRTAPFVQLFHMDRDPGEADNLAAAHPEIVAELAALLDKQIADGRSTPGNPLPNDVPRVNIHAAVPAFVQRREEIR